MNLRLSSALLFFAAILFFSSCEKEYSFENGGVPGVIVGGSSGGTAIFTFNGGTGSCTGAVASGTYTASTVAEWQKRYYCGGQCELHLWYGQPNRI